MKTFTTVKDWRTGNRKRSCHLCKASESDNECSLGFPCRDYKPILKCPKPLTYDQYVFAYKEQQKEQLTPLTNNTYTDGR
jgi:hypothetical protein